MVEDNAILHRHIEFPNYFLARPGRATIIEATGFRGGIVMFVIPSGFEGDPMWIKIVIATFCAILAYFAYRQHVRNGDVKGFGSLSGGWGFLLLIIGIPAALGLIYPLINEDAGSICHSVEKKFVLELARVSKRDDVGSLLMYGVAGELTQGSVAAGAVKGMYPDIPPFAGCYVAYYKMMFDPEFKRRIIQQFGSKLR